MKKHSLLDSIQVKNPCAESWDEMVGSEEIRFCSHCSKHVHNLSAVTRSDAMKIVAKSKGNICVRYAKLPDGKLSTSDRPLFQIGKRARIAAGAMATTLAVSAFAYSQDALVGKPGPVVEKKKGKSHPTTDPIIVNFTVVDAQGAVIPGAKITLSNVTIKETLSAISNADGVAFFKLITPGKYEVFVSEKPGFKELKTNLVVTSDSNVSIELVLEVTATELIGVVAIADYIIDDLADAISENNYERAKDAIQDGATLNPTERTNDLPPPLHQAVTLGYTRIVKLLLDSGANPNLRTSEGITPLDCAKTDEMRNLLKEYGAKEF